MGATTAARQADGSLRQRRQRITDHLGCVPHPLALRRQRSELQTLSLAERRQVRDWLDDMVEDDLEFTDDFEGKIRASETDMAAGRPSRTRGTPAPA